MGVGVCVGVGVGVRVCGCVCMWVCWCMGVYAGGNEQAAQGVQRAAGSGRQARGRVAAGR